jgi:tetratricopeptide (TPR) repeat protein
LRFVYQIRITAALRIVKVGKAMMTSWESIRQDVASCAGSNQLLPFLGAAISYFVPTALPLGSDFLHAALQGAFPDRNLFERPEAEWSDDEKAIDQHSAEVVLQGLAEGLLNHEKLTSLYNMMRDIPPNSLHHVMAAALGEGKVPAIFTTNQDLGIEDASIVSSCPIHTIYDEDGFRNGLHSSLFQFHGAIGGSSPEEVAKRKESLTVTLHGMGPHLPADKHQVLNEALSRFTLIFLGYSGSDPDIWYSLHELLNIMPQVRIYWCVHTAPSRHLARLLDRHPNSVTVFSGDIRTILKDLSKVWNVQDPGPVSKPTEAQKEMRFEKLRSWASDLTSEERELAYGCLLDSVGLHRQAAGLLEALGKAGKDQTIHVLALLFAGYARREIGDHIAAREHLKKALDESKTLDRCRYAQAAQKMGESLSAFESVRFWYWWPDRPRLHDGAKWLTQAIQEYKKLPPEDLVAKQLGRASLGNSKMNLGQLYRRTTRYTPFIPRPRLSKRARQVLNEAVKILEQEKDLRSLPMALAAAAADDPEKSEEVEAIIDASIEYSEQWNQDDIQVGSAYFAKGDLLATKQPLESEACYLKALSAFRQAEMNAEMARTELDLARVLSIQARQTIAETQGSREWRFGLRILGIINVVRALAFREIIMIVLTLLLISFVLGAVWG